MSDGRQGQHAEEHDSGVTHRWPPLRIRGGSRLRDRRRRRRRRVPGRVRVVGTGAAAGFLVLFGAGCGGLDKGTLEAAIKTRTNEQLEHAGRTERVSTVSCTKSDDAYHFDCDLADAGGKTFLRVRATCTKGGACRWKPVAKN